jgi:hypothetical protein
MCKAAWTRLTTSCSVFRTEPIFLLTNGKFTVIVPRNLGANQIDQRKVHRYSPVQPWGKSESFFGGAYGSLPSCVALFLFVSCALAQNPPANDPRAVAFGAQALAPVVPRPLTGGQQLAP